MLDNTSQPQYKRQTLRQETNEDDLFDDEQQLDVSEQEDEEEDDRFDERRPKKTPVHIFDILKFLNPFYWLSLLNSTLRTGCSIIFLLFIGLILLIIFQPPAVWEPAKSLLNGSLDPAKSSTEYDVDQTYQDIELQLATNQEISLSESQVADLLKDKLGRERPVGIDIEKDSIVLLFDVDDQGKPLWLATKFSLQEDENLHLDGINFGRIGVPANLVNSLDKKVFGLLDLIDKRSKQDVGNQIIDVKKINGFLISNIQMQQDKLVISFVSE